MVVGILLVVQLLDRVLSPGAETAAHLTAALLLLAVARFAGLSWADLGLAGGSALRRGILYALPAVALVAAVYALALALPPARTALLDERYQDDLSSALIVALVVIPLRTVLFEEVAFRGVLWALVRRSAGHVRATAVSSALFGVWHVMPSLTFAESSTLVTGVSDTSVGATATVGVVAGTVVVTAAAGVLLCELRRRSGSLLPPVALHWAVNGLGVIAASLAWSLASG